MPPRDILSDNAGSSHSDPRTFAALRSSCTGQAHLLMQLSPLSVRLSHSGTARYYASPVKGILLLECFDMRARC